MTFPVICTGHATTRFIQRHRLRFSSSVMSDPKHAKALLIKLFSEAKQSDFALKMRPGDYNIVCIKHGRRVHFHRNGNVVFCSTVENGRRVILTVLPTDIMIRGVSV